MGRILTTHFCHNRPVEPSRPGRHSRRSYIRYFRWVQDEPQLSKVFSPESAVMATRPLNSAQCCFLLRPCLTSLWTG
jgi:hypothetical protein